jgi:hypothetical protein
MFLLHTDYTFVNHIAMFLLHTDYTFVTHTAVLLLHTGCTFVTHISVLLLHTDCIFFPVPDNRCFLQSGGSAESFFVSEDQPVGAEIGMFKYRVLNVT